MIAYSKDGYSILAHLNGCYPHSIPEISHIPNPLYRQGSWHRHLPVRDMYGLAVA